jgi:NitT/TauT family transport system permease protein
LSDTDAIPEFKAKSGGDGQDVGITNLSAFSSGPGIKSMAEVLAIIVVAVIIIGGAELLLGFFEVPQYVLPKPSEIAVALVTDFHLILPHLGYTLVELLSGFAIGAVVGLVMAAVVTQFPFVEKVVTPYILLLVTTPMLALVPLLILRFGFGFTPRIIAVALAAGPMVMINAATGFRRVDRAKIALARSYGASTLQIFWKIRAPMALLVGGGFGLGNRLTSYSSMIQMPQFFAVVLILSILGILIYVLFFLIGKKWASWEA